MVDFLTRPCTAFAQSRILTRGPLVDVALAIREAWQQGGGADLTVFDDETGKVIDLDLRGSTAEIVQRLSQHQRSEVRGRGRPKLGVVPREVTLLPRQWEWLAAQPGGASQALRRLVDDARRADGEHGSQRLARERTYRFLNAMAGDLPHFEEACRALFAGDDQLFAERIAGWPADVVTYAQVLGASGQDGVQE